VTRTVGSPAGVEHLDRGPLDRRELAAMVARDIPPGSYVNLGIGQPTTVADYLDPEAGVVLHTENGMLGMGGEAFGDAIPAVGGAMDLAIGAKRVFVMMTLFAKDGTAKLVPECTYPLTGLRCVSRVYTESAIFDLDSAGDGLIRVRETFGVGVAALAERMDVELR
jgi:acyl CoA:acetate/3-ketoacid CoA transferase beta subunit